MIRKFGYARELERRDQIDENGEDPEQVLMRMRAAYPEFNPFLEPWNVLTDQGQQGSCQGSALSHLAQICLVQSHFVQRMFSRACGYYESQRHDNISGDSGSTLAGGQRVMSGDGIVLEEDWPYPSRYNNTRPAGFESMPRIKLKSSKTVTDAQMIWDLLDVGACIQTGVNWNASFDVPICERLSTVRGGGHSTILYGKNPETGHAVHHNSWANWQNNQRNQWTFNFLKDILARDRWAVFVAYESDGVEVSKSIIGVE